MAEALTNPYAQQPASLSSPVPDEAQEQATNVFSDIPDIDMQEPETDVFSDIPDVGQEPVSMGGEPVGDGFAPEPQSMEGLPVDVESEPGIGQMIREFIPRVKYAWAGNTREAARALQQSGKFDDVKIDAKDNTIKVKRPGKKGYSSFDFEDFEVMGELIDASRFIVEGAVETGLEAAGTLGLAAAAPGTAGASFAAQPALGATTAMTALAVGDVIAENFLGIERDPKRSRAKEMGIAGAFGAGFTTMSAGIARRRAARLTKERAAEVGVQKVKSMIDDVAGEQRILEEAGITFDKSTGNMVITPAQATGGSPNELVLTESKISEQPEYRNWVSKRGKELIEGWDVLTQTLEKKTLGKLTAGKNFKDKVVGLGDYFGKNIGMFRATAKKQASKKLPAMRSKQVVDEFMSMLGPGPNGILDAAGNPVQTPTKIKKLQEMLPGLSEGQANIVLESFENVQKKMQNGNLSVNEMDKFYKTLRTQIDNSYGKNPMNAPAQAVGDALLDLKNAMRDDYADAIGEVIGPQQRQAYEAFMNDYHMFKKGEESFSTLFKQSDISKKALINTIFEGKMSLSTARTMEIILGKENPLLWREISNEFFNELGIKYTKGPTNQPYRNWSGMAEKWKSVGPEMQDVLLRGAGVTKEQMRAMFNIGQRYQNTVIGELPAADKVGLIKSVYILLTGRGGAAAEAGALTELARRIGKGTSFSDYLKDGGAEAVLKSFPNYSPANKIKFMNWVDTVTTPPKFPGARGAQQTILRQGMTDREQQ